MISNEMMHNQYGWNINCLSSNIYKNNKCDDNVFVVKNKPKIGEYIGWIVLGMVSIVLIVLTFVYSKKYKQKTKLVDDFDDLVDKTDYNQFHDDHDHELFSLDSEMQNQ